MEDDAIINQREAMAMEDFKEEATGTGGSNGGLLDQLISTIIPAEKDATVVTEEEEEEEKGKGEGGGGILENLISNLTSPKANSDEQQQPENINGGGFIDTIVSHIPPISISENEGPSSDEASMLIHVVQD